MKNMKLIKFLSKIIIIAMLFTSNSFFVLADSINFSSEENIEKPAFDVYEKIYDEEVIDENLNEDEFSQEDLDDGEEVTPEELEDDGEEVTSEEPEEDVISDEPEEDEDEVTPNVEKEDGEEVIYDELEEGTTSDDPKVVEEENNDSLITENNNYLLDGELFAGTVDVDETITLDFGHTPRFDKSLNWGSSTTGVLKFDDDSDENGYKYSITGDCGDLIYNSLFDTTDAPYIIRGQGSKHLELPDYDTDDNAVWDGFKFIGWIDSNGFNLMDTQQGAFKEAFQYGAGSADAPNDTTYTASWEAVANPQEININYYRSKNNPPTTEGAFQFFDEETINANHGDTILIETKTITGYKVEKCDIYVDGDVIEDNDGTTTIPNRGLLEKDVYGEYYINDALNDLQFDTNYVLSGNMPNHDIKIDLFFAPSENAEGVLTVNYQSVDGAEVHPSIIISTKAEAELTYTPIEINGYSYKEAMVSCGEAIPEYGIYELGNLDLFHIDGEILAPSDNTDTSSNQGKFHGLMPNQDLTITYKYEMTDGTDDIIVIIGKEQEGGFIATESYLIEDVQVADVDDWDPEALIFVDNLENQGYGSPIFEFNDIIIDYTPYDANNPGDKGILKYKLVEFGNPSINITYNFNYTNANYWTKLGYNFKSLAAGGKGTIEASAGTKPLTERFFKRGVQYHIVQLIANIDINPVKLIGISGDEISGHYMPVIYKSSATMEPTGDPLASNGTVQLLDSTYDLFVAFEENPDYWFDINYTNVTNCTLDGILTTHIAKNTIQALKENISSPSVIVSAGYKWEGATLVDSGANKYEGGVWLDESGAEMEDIIDSSKTYHPSIVIDFEPYAGAVRPVSNLTFDSSGFATAKPFGTYTERKYVLASSDDKVIEVKTGSQARNAGFTNLKPGHTYHLYECREDASIPAVGSSIASSGTYESATISEKFIINVPALNGNYSSTVNSITVTARAGIEYALLNPDRTVAKNWGEAFTGLTDSRYYIVVARGTTETSVNATDDSVIENGVPVYTEMNDLTNREYRVILLGSGVSAQGVSGGTNITGGKVYKIAAGTTVNLKVTGNTNGKEWEVLSNNVTLSSYIASQPTFTMPNEDVVIRHFTKITATSNYDIDVHSLYHMGLADKEAYAAFLQTDDTVTGITGLSVSHHVVLNKTCATSDIDGMLTPYEYSLDVGMVIQGSPYPYTSIDPMNADKLKTYITYEKGLQGNIGFVISEGDLLTPYNETVESKIGAGSLTLESKKRFAYVKMHKVKINCKIDGTLGSFDETSYIRHGYTLSYDNTVYSAFINKLYDYWSPDNYTFNAKEYKFINVKDESNNEFDYENTPITKNMTITYYHELNQERETEKSLLNSEITAADQKLSTLYTQIAKASLSNAKASASTVRNNQRNYTVEQIHQAYLTLKTAVDTAADIIPTGTVMTIMINANGGTADITEINVQVGEQYTELASVSVTRSGYTFKHWNTTANDSGTTITPTMIVPTTNAPTELYAIWQHNVNPSPTPTPSGNTGGGGGGGGGGNHIAPGVGEEVIINPLTGYVEASKKLGELGYTNARVYEERKDCNTVIVYDPIENLYFLRIIDYATGEPVKNQWTIKKDNFVILKYFYYTYNFDENGNARTGFYTEGNEVYYFSKVLDDKYATLQTGWVYEPTLNSYYYFSPLTGAMAVGWQNIDGKDYYFAENASRDIFGNLNFNNSNASCGYGKMLSNCFTPDGYLLDKDGARVVNKPSKN